MNSKCHYHFSIGSTLLELLVAIAISSMVMGLLFFTYTNVARGFFRQIGKAGHVQHLLLVKKQIDREFDDIAVVVSQQEKRLDYKLHDSDILHTFRFDATKASVDSRTIAQGLSDFKCSITRDPNGSARAALSWEAWMGTGWIGGAKEVFIAP
jgi:hypothetical protein